MQDLKGDAIKEELSITANMYENLGNFARSFLILLLSLTLQNNTLSTPFSVPYNHLSYQLLERLQAKGILKDTLSNVRPYSRDDVARLLAMAWRNGEKLSKIEREQLKQLMQEFVEELQELGLSNINSYSDIIDWSEGNKRFRANTGYYSVSVLTKGTESYKTFRNSLRIDLEVNLEDDLLMKNDNTISHVSSNDPQVLMRQHKTRYYMDEVNRDSWFETDSNAYLILRSRWTDLQFGKDYILWGPGHHGVIGLSAVDPTFSMVRFPFSIGRLKFVNILGFLRHDPGRSNLSKDIIKKYISAHRLEVKIMPGLLVGWQEAYIYDKFHIELANPFMPYEMAHDYFADTGNYVSEGDIDICLIPNVRLYASLFLDDLHIKNPFTYGANRWAILMGIFIVDPFSLDNLDLRAEYARVEPWTYSNKGVIEQPPAPTSYNHFDVPLGHWIGSNADDLFFELRYQINKSFSINSSFFRIRIGEIGSNLYEYSDKAMSSKKKFLDGITEKTYNFGLSACYRFHRDSSIRMGYNHLRIKNKQKEEAKLPPNDPKKKSWEAGYNAFQNIFQVNIDITY